MTVATEALVLKVTPLGEADLVVALLTRRFGRLSLLARGARKSRKRFGGGLDYFHLVRAEVKPGRGGLGTLAGIEPLRGFDVVRAGMEAYWAGSHVLEVARLGSREGAPDDGLFELVEASLAALGEGAAPRCLTRVFQARVLAALGYALPTQACPGCGEPWGATGRRAAHRDGAVLCAPCAGPRAAPLSVGALRTLGLAAALELGRLATLRVPPAIDGELEPFLTAALAAALGTAPRAPGAAWEFAPPQAP